MTFRQWLTILAPTEDTKLADAVTLLEQTAASARYSVEVNYRSGRRDVLEAFAKILLGYVSAALKQNGFHVKQVFEQHPIRILVSMRNWDDGEYVGIVSFNLALDGGSFVLSKGFLNRDRKSVSVQSSKKCDGDSAAAVTAELRNMMHALKGQPDRHLEKLKPVPMKRGPKG